MVNMCAKDLARQVLHQGGYNSQCMGSSEGGTGAWLCPEDEGRALVGHCPAHGMRACCLFVFWGDTMTHTPILCFHSLYCMLGPVLSFS